MQMFEKKDAKMDMKDCPECAGKGLDPEDFTKLCSMCKGTGKIKA